MATRSSVLAWRIPETEEPGELYSQGHKELDMTEVTKHISNHYVVYLKLIQLVSKIIC